MKKYLLFISAIFILSMSHVYAAPINNIYRSLIPEATDLYYVGTSTPSTLEYQGIFTKNITITGTCTGAGCGSSVFPFTPQSYGNSTTSVIAFLAGFMATGSSTITGNATTSGMQSVGSLFINNQLFTNLLGNGLSNLNGVLTVTTSGGSGSVSTSSNEVAGQIPVFTSNSATPALISGFPNFTWTNASNLLKINGNASTTLLSITGIGYFGGSSTTTIQGNGNLSSFFGSVNIASTSAKALNVQDQYASDYFTVQTASTTGDIFDVASSTGIVYFGISQNGQITSSSTMPVLSSCGTTPSFYGDDAHMTVTVGSISANSCTITFGTPYPKKPTCNVTNQSMSVVNAMTYTVSATAIVVSQTALTGDLIDINCFETGNGG